MRLSRSSMEPIEISYRLRCLGKSQTQIARELQVSSGVVGNVIHGRITAHAVASYIAQLLGCTIDDLWPGQYTFKPRRRAMLTTTRAREPEEKSKRDASIEGGGT